MLGAAQVDRFANLNTTVIGSYDRPKVRLPGAGGAPEIASACPRSIIVMRQSKRTFVDELDYVTTIGFGNGAGARSRLGMPGAGPRVLISDLGIFRPDPLTFEMTLTALHPGTTVAEVRDATGWNPAVSDDLVETSEPTDEELVLLRRLHSASGAAARD
jgi:glutaconate CoA-transferase subunit B